MRNLHRRFLVFCSSTFYIYPANRRKNLCIPNFTSSINSPKRNYFLDINYVNISAIIIIIRDRFVSLRICFPSTIFHFQLRALAFVPPAVFSYRLLSSSSLLSLSLSLFPSLAPPSRHSLNLLSPILLHVPPEKCAPASERVH